MSRLNFLDMGKIERLSKEVLFVNSSELCELFGVELSTLYYFQSNLGMPKLGKNKFDVKACCAWYIKKLKKDANVGANEKLIQEKISLTKHKAKKAEVENSILSGDFVAVVEVKKDLISAISILKDGLLNFCGKFANEINNIKTSAQAYELAIEAVTDLLNSMSKKIRVLENE